MKKYKKTYEDIYTAKKSTRKCDIKKVSSLDELDGDRYRLELRRAVIKFEKDLFDNLIKVKWLMNRFCYDGVHRSKPMGNGFYIEKAYGVFLRHHVGIDNRMFSKNQFYSKINSYFKDFFSDFDSNNPFKKKYKYPYRYMTLECLIVVYAMKERMDILNHCERARMKYTKFLDYVINYIYSYNEDVGYQYYHWVVNYTYIPYIGINKQYEEKIEE